MMESVQDIEMFEIEEVLLPPTPKNELDTATSAGSLDPELEDAELIKVEECPNNQTSQVLLPSSLSSHRTGYGSPCIFCLRNAPKEPQLFEADMPGATCPQLQKHLQIFFVVQNLLDLPNSMCEEILRSDKYPDIHYWLRICGRCFPTIEKSWKLYQEMLMIQTKINDMKAKLKQKIFTSKAKNWSHKPGRNKVDLMNEIREVITSNGELKFSEILNKFESTNPSYKPGRQQRKPQIKIRNFEDPSKEEVIKLKFDDKYDNAEGDNRQDPDFLVPSDTEDGNMSDSEWAPVNDAHRSRRTPANRRNRYTRKYPWRCKLCPAKFGPDGGQEKLQDHMQVHERSEKNGNLFACQRCNFPYENDTDLELHIARRHPKSLLTRKEIVCKLCSYTTRRRYKFDQHVKAEHPGQEEESGLHDELKCDICQKICGSVQAVSLHKKRSHSEIFGQKADLDSLYQCDECGEKFDNGFRLEHHKNIHKRQKNPNRFRYFCEICGKGYYAKCRLEYHMASHNEVGAWMCSTCGMDFKFKHGLNRHRQRNHPEEFAPEQIDPDLVRKRNCEDFIECKVCKQKVPTAFRRRHMKTHLDPDKAYKCDQCDRMYFKLQALNKHKEINHSNGEYKVNCPFCNKEFIHKEYLKWHYRHCQVKKTVENSSAKEGVKEEDEAESKSLAFINIAATTTLALPATEIVKEDKEEV